MGANEEYYNEIIGAGVIWAGSSLEGKQPRAIVSEWIGNIKQITGGDWQAPKAVTIAGNPGGAVVGRGCLRQLCLPRPGLHQVRPELCHRHSYPLRAPLEPRSR